MTNYQIAKSCIKYASIEAKKDTPTDRPKIRIIINNYVDYLSKEYKLSEYQRNLLSNYACKLHPKD